MQRSPRGLPLVEAPGVSILTRAFARVQPSPVRARGRFSARFNPHSSFRPSATLRCCRLPAPLRRFNPHSSFRPSATRRVGVRNHCPAVSILTRAFARVQQAGWEVLARAADVSILTRAFARVQRSGALGSSQGCSTFQSSLELSPECNLAV